MMGADLFTHHAPLLQNRFEARFSPMLPQREYQQSQNLLFNIRGQFPPFPVWMRFSTALAGWTLLTRRLLLSAHLHLTSRQAEPGLQTQGNRCSGRSSAFSSRRGIPPRHAIEVNDPDFASAAVQHQQHLQNRKNSGHLPGCSVPLPPMPASPATYMPPCVLARDAKIAEMPPGSPIWVFCC